MRWGWRRKSGSSPQGLGDRELAMRAAHDPEAFGALYDRHVKSIYRLVYSRVRNQALAEDLTARVFTRALKLVRTKRYAGSWFGTWLRALALATLARRAYVLRRGRQGPAMDQGFESAGRPAPIRPRMPSLSAAAAAPLPPIDDGPGIAYALGRSR